MVTSYTSEGLSPFYAECPFLHVRLDHVKTAMSWISRVIKNPLGLADTACLRIYILLPSSLLTARAFCGHTRQFSIWKTEKTQHYFHAFRVHCERRLSVCVALYKALSAPPPGLHTTWSLRDVSSGMIFTLVSVVISNLAVFAVSFHISLNVLRLLCYTPGFSVSFPAVSKSFQGAHGFCPG